MPAIAGPTLRPAYSGPVRTTKTLPYGTDEVPDDKRVSDLDQRKPAYDRLLEDGRLDISVVYGFDTPNRKAMLGCFLASLDCYQDLGWKAAKINDRSYLLTRTANIAGKPVELRLRLMAGRDNPTIKQDFVDSLRQDEVIIFAGHTRFHQGLRLAPGHEGFLRLAGAGAAADLSKVTFGDHDQLLVLMSCKSEEFCDELRTRKGPKRLKIFAGNCELAISDYPEMVERFVERLEKMGSAQQLIDALDKGNGFTPEGAWRSYGFADDAPGLGPPPTRSSPRRRRPWPPAV